MATPKRGTSPKARNPASSRGTKRVKVDHSSEAPSPHEQPGGGRPGDEGVTPADREALQDLVEEAKSGTREPRQPVGQILPPGNKVQDVREAEELINDTGLEDDDADEERAPAAPSGAVGAEVEPKRRNGRL